MSSKLCAPMPHKLNTVYVFFKKVKIISRERERLWKKKKSEVKRNSYIYMAHSMTDVMMHAIPPPFRAKFREFYPSSATTSETEEDLLKAIFGQMITMCAIYLVGKMLHATRILPKTFNRAWILTMYTRYVFILYMFFNLRAPN